MNDDNNTDDGNPSHIAVKQVAQFNDDDQIAKNKIVGAAGDSDGEYSSLGSSGPEDDPDGDLDAGGVMDIDEARAAMGESNDGDGEFRKELSDDDLNLNALDDISTPRMDDADELDKTA